MDAASWIDIDAPILEVFSIVSDVERFPRWQPDIKTVECLEYDGNGRAAVIHIELETAIRKTTADLRVTYAEPHQLTWVMERGDVRGFEGSWTLLERDDGQTRVHYTLKIDFGRKMGRLLRGPAGKALGGAVASSMPTKLKRYVEACLTESAVQSPGL
jgi:ribosome-associated toxin RatA of RatAB toxin-antitoxin module